MPQSNSQCSCLICFVGPRYWPDVWISALTLSSATGCFTDNFTFCWLEMCSWERHLLNFQIENYLLRNHETRKYLQEQAYRLQQGIVTSTTQQVRGHQAGLPHTLYDALKSRAEKNFCHLKGGTIRTGIWKWQQMLSRVWGTM